MRIRRRDWINAGALAVTSRVSARSWAFAPRQSIMEPPPPFGATINTSLFRGDAARTGHQPGPAPTEPVGIRWAFHTSSKFIGSPLIAQDAIIVGNEDGYLFAINRNTGQAIWGVATPNAVRSTATVVGEVVYITAGDLMAFNITNGDRYALRVDEEDRLTIPGLPFDGAIVAGGVRGNSGFIDARDAVTGRTRWRIRLYRGIVNAVARRGNILVGGSLSADLLALHPGTGKEQWRTRLEGPIYCAPALSDDTIYVTSWMDLITGDVRNSVGLLYALDLETGAEVWRFPVSIPVNSSPALVDDAVIVGGGQELFALDAATGEEQWRVSLGGQVLSSPVVVGGEIIVGAEDGVVSSFAVTTGDRVWTVDIGSAVNCSAAVADGVVYVTSGQTVMALANDDPN